MCLCHRACVCVCVCVCVFMCLALCVMFCLQAARVTQLVHPCDSERAAHEGRTQVMSGAGVPWVNTLGYK